MADPIHPRWQPTRAQGHSRALVSGEQMTKNAEPAKRSLDSQERARSKAARSVGGPCVRESEPDQHGETHEAVKPETRHR